MPPGIRLTHCHAVDSTNAEALRRAARGEAAGLWVWADRQLAGRGRAGRVWASETGNLYASLLLRPDCTLAGALELSLLAGLAAHSAIEAVTRRHLDPGALRLKWPNDILLGGAKLGGVLLESTGGENGRAGAVVMGTGLNLASHPEGLSRPATDLGACGLSVPPAGALTALIWATEAWLARWRNGKGFAAIRAAWLDRAQGIGEPVSVHVGGDLVTGTFLGIDDTGALKMGTASGGERRVTAGDITFGQGR